jgi:hypothetical protein
MIGSVASKLFTVGILVAVLPAAVPLAHAVTAAPMAPSPRQGQGLAYDAARGEVVLFGGQDGSYLGQTWTWDGSDWTKLTPAHSPPARAYLAMAYDAARDQVVLFGGFGGSYLGDTWTWDGSDWTMRTPGHSPTPRTNSGMASDAAGQVLLFGGGASAPFGDTWSWDGSDWAERTPAHSPSARQFTGMAFDAAIGEVVLFGGADGGIPFADTWTWNGSDWTLRAAGSIKVRPRSGPVGTVVQVTGWGFGAGEIVRLSFIDFTQGTIFLARRQADSTGAFATQITIPLAATPGTQHVKASGVSSGEIAKRGFTVT